jgi:formate dehydrogenase subunit gamma
MSKLLRRYSDSERMNHWVLAIAFVLAGLSGLAFFHPSFYFFTNLFGGGQWTRILHPFIGVVMFLSFLGLFFRLWRQNLIKANDRAWRKQAGQMLRGNKEGLPPAGKYNYGQKVVFWLMVISLLVLILTGFVFWRPWFTPYFSIELMRLAVLLHSISAVVLVLSVIVHIYAAIWVKGTMRAMTRGTVTEGWARLNHRLWHDEVTRGR